MSIPVTGAPCFIGFRAATELLARGQEVCDFDNRSSFYSVALRQMRLVELEKHAQGKPSHRVYNLGNRRPQSLLRLIGAVEKALGLKVRKEMLPLQPRDVPQIYAGIAASRHDLGFEPSSPIEVGIPRFLA